MKDKTIDCLKLCSMQQSSQRNTFEVEICEKYSEKAVYTKLDELSRRGYIEYGTSITGTWLTEKGKKALREAVNARA